MYIQPDAKLGRNDLCHCGSGKKYKKCCIDLDVNQCAPDSRHPSGFYPIDGLSELQTGHMAQISTTTNEPYMPARLYYRVHDRQKLDEKLRSLKCVSVGDNGNLNLSYWHEAKKFGLSVRYNRVPEDIFPILLGTLHFSGDEMLIDVRSYERGWRMIEFLDRYIGRAIAEVTHLATYNRAVKLEVARAEEVMGWDYDQLFSPETLFMEPSYQDSDDDDLEDMDINDAPTPEQKARWEKNLSRPFPLTSKYAVPFYDDGFSVFKTLLLMRMMLAVSCADEDATITLGEALKKLSVDIQSMSLEDEIEDETPVSLLAS